VAAAYRQLAVEAELVDTCRTVLGVLDQDLIPKAATGESTLFYQKLKADHCRYIAEYSIDDAKQKASEDARAAYEEAYAVASRTWQ